MGLRTGHSGPARVRRLFRALGVDGIGRAIGPDDDRVPNGHPVAMLSHGYWERRFARDPLVIGRTIRLSGMPFTIIGVTPAEFFGVEIGTAPDVSCRS